jgi:hypothetical protein
MQILFQNPVRRITICLATRIDCFPVDPSTKCDGVPITQSSPWQHGSEVSWRMMEYFVDSIRHEYASGQDKIRRAAE